MNIEELELDRLEPYLEQNLTGSPTNIEAKKFGGGQSNPTFLIKANGKELVLRRQPPGSLLKSAHAVDREFKVIHALRDTQVPVPRAYHLCEDTSVIGSKFFIMSFEPGRIFWNPALPELSAGQRKHVYSEMCQTLASLHSVDPNAIGLADFGKPGNYFERQIGRWTEQYRASETAQIREMEELIDWLPKNLPRDDERIAIIHGDFRLDNLIFHSDLSGVRAILDWELSTLGHPLADLSYQCMQLRMPQDAVLSGLGTLDRSALGIPSEERYVEMYCKHVGMSAIADWDFYLMFSFFKFAAILQGVRKRALDGNASNEKALAYGALTPTLARMAVELVDEKAG